MVQKTFQSGRNQPKTFRSGNHQVAKNVSKCKNKHSSYNNWEKKQSKGRKTKDMHKERKRHAQASRRSGDMLQFDWLNDKSVNMPLQWQPCNLVHKQIPYSTEYDKQLVSRSSLSSLPGIASQAHISWTCARRKQNRHPFKSCCITPCQNLQCLESGNICKDFSTIRSIDHIYLSENRKDHNAIDHVNHSKQRRGKRTRECQEK